MPVALVVYRVSAGLPNGGLMTVVADYDDLSGECLTDVHAGLRAGLAVSVEPCTVTADEWDGIAPFAGMSFLFLYARAVLAGPFMTDEDRDWLTRKGLIQPTAT